MADRRLVILIMDLSYTNGGSTINKANSVLSNTNSGWTFEGFNDWVIFLSRDTQSNVAKQPISSKRNNHVTVTACYNGGTLICRV